MKQRTLGKIRSPGLDRRARLQQLRGAARVRGVARGRRQGDRPRHHVLRHGGRLRQARRIGGLPRPDPRRAPQAGRALHEVRRVDDAGRDGEEHVAPVRHDRGRSEPATAPDRLHRRLHAPPAGRGDADRGDAARPGRPDPAGEGPHHRLLQPAGVAGRRSAVDVDASRTASLRLRPGRIQSRQPRAGARPHPGARRLRPRPAALLPAGERSAERQVPARCADARGLADRRFPAVPGPAPERCELGDRRGTACVLRGARAHRPRARLQLARLAALRVEHHRRGEHARAARAERDRRELGADPRRSRRDRPDHGCGGS